MMERTATLLLHVPLILALLASGFQAPAAAMTVELLSPANSTWTPGTNGTLPFSFRFSDPYNASAGCGLFVNQAGEPKGTAAAQNWTAAQVNSSVDFSDGYNTWWVECFNGTPVASPSFVFWRDRSPPVVSLVSPLPGANAGYGTVNFTFAFQDQISPFASCTVYANGVARATNLSACRGIQTHLQAPMSPGQYYWSSACTDLAGNRGDSETYELFVAGPLSVSIASPQNMTYTYINSIQLNVTVQGTPQILWYRIDGGSAVFFSGNVTFNAGYEGRHCLDVYANDSTGQSASAGVCFTAALPRSITIVSPLDQDYAVGSVEANVTIDTDASWCGLSLDGGANASMAGGQGRSWTLTLGSLAPGAHSLGVLCNDSFGAWAAAGRSFRIVSSGIPMSLVSPANTTYWNSTSLQVSVAASGAASCQFAVESEGPYMMSNSSATEWGYRFPFIAPGSYLLAATCNDSSGFSNSSAVAFTITGLECTNASIGICTAGQRCAAGRCEESACEGCTHLSGGSCVPYECCAPGDCPEEETCEGHECVPVNCTCGMVAGHECVRNECCSNFDCPAGQTCQPDTNTCTRGAISLRVPQAAVVGQEFEVMAIDANGAGVPGVQVIVRYPGGSIETFITDGTGKAMVTLAEAGRANLTARISGYPDAAATVVAGAGFNWWGIVAVIIIAAMAGGAYFYLGQLPPVILRKSVAGQSVTLSIRNRSGDFIRDVMVMDTVPSKALLSAEVEPEVETIGNEDHLTWMAALNPRENMIITYKAAATSGTFTLKAGEQEFQSGYGLLSMAADLWEMIYRALPLKKFLRKQKPEEPEE